MAEESKPAMDAVAENRPGGSSPASAPAAPAGRPWKRLAFYALLVVAGVLGAPYGWDLWQYYQSHESTDDAYIVSDIIAVSARINGTVLSVHVEEHQQVEAGQLLARLDPRDFDIRVQQAESVVAVAAARLRQTEIEVPLTRESTASDTARSSANVRVVQSGLRETQHRIEEARARRRAQEAAVAAARADVDLRQARLDIAKMALDRMQQLVADGVVAQQQFDEADGNWRAAQAAWRGSQQQLAQAESEVERAQVDLRMQQQTVVQARARISEAQALLAGSRANHQNVDMKQAEVQVARALLQQKQTDLAYAQQQLAYTTLAAPASGRIARKNLEVGQVIQAGRPLLAIVPWQDVWVEANYKETQLQHMQPGQKAMLKVDAYPGQTFTGTVASISPGTGSVFSLLPPENATGNFVKVVQRVPVKIVLDAPADPTLVLRPGMSVIATVATR